VAVIPLLALTCTAAVDVLNVDMKLSRLPHLALIASNSSPPQGAASWIAVDHDKQTQQESNSGFSAAVVDVNTALLCIVKACSSAQVVQMA
jgi:hypothetical protein